VLHCVAVCCSVRHTSTSESVYESVSVLQCVAVCCSVLQCVAACCSVLQCVALLDILLLVRVSMRVSMCCSVLQCVAVCCNVLQSVAVCCAAVCCSVLQCVRVFDIHLLVRLSMRVSNYQHSHTLHVYEKSNYQHFHTKRGKLSMYISVSNHELTHILPHSHMHPTHTFVGQGGQSCSQASGPMHAAESPHE